MTGIYYSTSSVIWTAQLTTGLNAIIPWMQPNISLNLQHIKLAFDSNSQSFFRELVPSQIFPNQCLCDWLFGSISAPWHDIQSPPCWVLFQPVQSYLPISAMDMLCSSHKYCLPIPSVFSLSTSPHIFTCTGCPDFPLGKALCFFLFSAHTLPPLWHFSWLLQAELGTLSSPHKSPWTCTSTKVIIELYSVCFWTCYISN